MNLGVLYKQNIERFGEYQNLYFEGVWYTNVQVEAWSNRLANALRSLGIQKGDRVAIQMPNCPHLFWTFAAIYKIGAVAVPLSPLLRPEQSAYIYSDSGAVAVITSADYIQTVKAAQQQAPALRHVILTEKRDIPGVLFHDDLLARQPDTCTLAETENDDVAALVYTAGTTGNAKGVMHTHFGFYICSLDSLHYTEQLGSYTFRSSVSGVDPRTNSVGTMEFAITGIVRDTVSLAVLPLSHIYGIYLTNAGLLTASKSIVMKWWNVEQALKYIQDFKVSSVSFVPTMYAQMLEHPDFDKYNLSSLYFCNSGGAPLPPEVARKWKEKTGLYLSNGWGMTETGAASTGQEYGKVPKPGSIGKCILNCMSMKVVDDNDNALPPGQTGELVVKGPCVMKGYWNKPEQTAEALRNGWMHRGDVGHMDEDGYFYITDRKKDIIIRGGENVSPKEVEEVMLELPAVLDAGVIGVPDKIYGEEIAAFCVLRPGQSVTADEVIGYCKKKLPGYKTPKTVKFIDSLPRNALGKLLRTELRKLEAA